ncbi:uncharacterized protein AMSG_00750 [Thecamonas trahens ATCC 50062]|uniref:Cilia- and flagella-associated protein 418 n=1 Tax=Thecamonas trahens ATCC 50062 TaxID=461836 RepID=A0A0L0DE48_THETB|nr:hypothetical protein AMSG_00750 [Thecamonas trahens ATCC 50062]KNC50592.1 hypothetical protein AMSG_00750 [Thecamonas trahens ATCC 50062]|eukprot:XP_013762479.1 hypothetical protein AMSG_00750 [Thecamonas trahens ATCC 50062]
MDDLDDLLDEVDELMAGGPPPTSSRTSSSTAGARAGATAGVTAAPRSRVRARASRSRPSRTQARADRATASRRGKVEDGDDDDDDDDLDDLLALDVPSRQRRSGGERVVSTAVSTAVSSGGGGGGGKRKCRPVFLADASLAGRGRTASAAMPRACDRLRCSRCCFAVKAWPDSAWDAGVDYLFLRYNFPDTERIAPMLVPTSAGSTALACQCAWRTVTTPTRLQSGEDLAWFCAGHA